MAFEPEKSNLNDSSTEFDDSGIEPVFGKTTSLDSFTFMVTVESLVLVIVLSSRLIPDLSVNPLLL